MPLLKEFINNIKEQNLFQKKDKLLLAVSGGVDSVALCELCYQAGFDFEIAHCNFQLRGEESGRDETFVRKLAEKYGVNIYVKKFDTKKYAEKNKTSIQVAARVLRYNWFLEVCYEKKMGLHEFSNLNDSKNTGGWQITIDSGKPKVFLLTAHHANDHVETLLMNFFKGTGIKGLQGMHAKHELLPWIIRPMLFAKREEIVQFVNENNLVFVEDSSNSSDKYTRNYFRHQLIPSIQKIFPQVEENLLNNIERFKEIEILYNQSILFHKKKLLEKRGSEIHIPVLKLMKATPVKTILYEIIKDYDFTPHQTDEVLNLLTSESGKYVSSSSYRIIRNRNWLIIAPVNTLEAGNILIEEKATEIIFAQGILTMKSRQHIGESISSSGNMATLDKDKIAFPLLLRKWKQGDYFYPLGMQKKKKLSKFFIDQKLSLTDKEKIWVIESDKRIVWVVDKRIDDRFKITSSTKNIFEIRVS